ncbi:Acyltransferase family protein [compost metagenome]
MENQAQRSIRGLDSIRFVCAFWVAVSHLGLPDLPIGNAYKLLFNGPAAVIVFFVVSGLCIHYPHRDGRTPRWSTYFVRRYVRILLPLAAGLLFAHQVGLPIAYFRDGILWSLVAEMLYYTAYPLILIGRRLCGWKLIIGASTALSLTIVLTNSHLTGIPQFGFGLAWLICLPSWLLGCRLAETIDRDDSPSRLPVWIARLGVLGAGALCTYLDDQTPLHYSLTLPLFGFVACGWLSLEIARFKVRSPWRALEWGGTWSYSLYLLHLPASKVFAMLSLPAIPYLNWAGYLGLTMLISYGFFLLVERPAHEAAKRLSGGLRGRSAEPMMAGTSP